MRPIIIIVSEKTR